MTRAKKLKKAVRARARKTGESYAAARHQLLKSRGSRPAASPPRTPAPPAHATGRPVEARSGVRSASVLKRTGHDLDHWFAVLDAFGAPAKGHTAAARHLYEAHGVPGWHAQMITVAYERDRGLRAVNQASTGGFQVSVSRAVPAAVADVAEALRSPRRRGEWLREADPSLVRALDAALGGPKPKTVKARDARSARLRYRWGRSTVEIRIAAKSRGATIAADNMGLADAAQVEERPRQWRVALDALRKHLGG